MLLADRGRKFSGIELLLNLHYETLERFRQIQVGEKPPEVKLFEGMPSEKAALFVKYCGAIEKHLRNYISQLSQVFIEAVNSHDSDKIIQIAEAVKLFPTFKPQGDPVRSKILFNKMLLDQKAERWTIGQLAKIMEWPEDDQANGFPHLRRLCKELEFPLAPGKPNKQKEIA